MKILDGKAIVITGAGAGLGAAYARHCARLGARLVVNDVNADAARAIAAEVAAAGGEAVAFAGSVASWDFAAELVAACVSAYGRIDGLLNNAGILRHARITEMTEADLRATIDVNLVGTAACASHAIRQMLKQDAPATVVNVASGSQAGDIALGAYGATKAAVASLTYTWALELQGTNVRVNALSPLAHTAMAETNMKFLAQQSASREVVYTSLPPADVNAPAAAFLLSDASIGINGQLVRIADEELSFVTHPMIAEPVLRGRWDDAALADAFAATLNHKQQKLGLAYARSMVS